MSLKITLWGNQASNFSISDVYNQSINQPIVILLVGFLAKRFKGYDPSFSKKTFELFIPTNMITHNLHVM
jgi:hypothetical protein